MDKYLKFLLLFIIFTSAFSNVSNAQTDTAVIATSAQCDMCKNKIENALRFEKGVKLATLDVKSKNVTVIYNSKKTDADKIRKAISMLGYDADNISADSASYNKLHECCRKPHLE
ncbi:MAG TPA: heavy metal-associated domain-containing protein [Bacteroidia bacterium]|nr:heavy metal-associated domain-containing protein [Bacteroidia bacterium]